MVTFKLRWIPAAAAAAAFGLAALPGWAQSNGAAAGGQGASSGTSATSAAGTTSSTSTAGATNGTGASGQSVASLQEVVVTARRRSELSTNVPITLSVFTAQEIQSAGITEPRDFIAMVPNMTMVETQNVGNSFITIRGISQARNSESSVAVLVDGVEEPNPYEFNQELFDIQQITVLKGPQGALYGRDAIGGAILIQTAPPSDHFESAVRVGVGNGVSETVQYEASGPIDSAGTLKYRASLNFYNTNGYLENVYLDRKADPDRDYSGRLRLLWTPSDAFTADLRISLDRTETTAYYFVVPRDEPANPFSSFTTPGEANDTTSPIQVNNEGEDNRNLYNTALKLDFDTGRGKVTSISDYDQTREIDTGDAYDFRPIATSVYLADLGFDLNQSQFIWERSWSEDLRFTSNASGGFKWIAGAYYLHTDRFVSTGNMIDNGDGVFPVYYAPRLGGDNPSFSYLADADATNAWAVYGDATYELTHHWELDAALRYDSDTTSDTTDTPTAFLPDPTVSYAGEVRSHTWSAMQPKGTIRYKPTEDLTFYGGWSRGFRSGGFNQTGVGAVARASDVAGVNDQFSAEIADTIEIGSKMQFLDQRLSVDADVFHTHSQNGYFFVYLPANSTQNLGNLNATYKGAELAITARPTDRLDLYASYGYTDSKITAMADPTVLGNQAPLVSHDTITAGGEYRQPLPRDLLGTVRLDFSDIGRTWWDPYDSTSRNPVPLVNLRLGVGRDNWTVTAWSKNLTNTIYNSEFSPGGFLWRALPRRYGINFEYHFQ
ncbi:MAG: TonB-dependent receptor [Steroidobacteraceae bacterium]